MTPSTPPRALLDELERTGVAYTVIPHRRTMTARDEARAIDMPPSRVAKTLVLTTPSGFVRAVLPASLRLDLHKARLVLGEREARLATEEELAGAYPDFELGAVPPLVIVDGDRVLVDVRLCGIDDVVVEAGTHDRSIRISTTDLLELSQAELADIALDG
jgi:Ala-tRNA(Pro) deacylase